MKSSSSAARSAVVDAPAGELLQWTPEVIPIRGRLPSTHREVDRAIGQAVEDALATQRAALDAERERLEADLETRREELVREAYERGYEEGRVAGELAEGARLRNAVAAAEEALDSLRAGELRWTGTIEENVCALAVVVARQVIGRELKADVGPVADLVRNALTEFPIDQAIRIRINPADLNALSSVGAVEADPLQSITGDREARWHPDASIAPGGVMVEGRERIIDGRVDTALERVYRRLTYTHA